MLHPLESRRLLAVSLDFDGILRVSGDFKKTGSPKDDRIVVTQDFDQGFFVFQNDETFGPFDISFVDGIEVDGGGGRDKILCRNGDDSTVFFQVTLFGSAGNDTLEGGDNSDIIVGGSGNDSLAGGLGGDSIYGEAGSDRLVGSLFASVDVSDFSDDGDLLDGGSGRDIADYSMRLESLFLSNDNINDDGLFGSDFFTGAPSPQESDNILSNVEDLFGGAGNDAIAGPGADNFAAATGSSNSLIDGGGGDDALFGELGNDTLVGGKGDDTLSGGTGADFLMGGSGTDFLLGDYRFLRSSDFAPLFDFFPADFLGDTLDGGDGDDFIRGGGDNFFPEQSGNDSIIGGLGNDFLFGDDGNDIVNSGAGTDVLEGDAGNDTLLAGNDDDLILNRTFDFQGPDADSVDGGDGFDIAQSDFNDTQPTPATIEFFFDDLDGFASSTASQARGMKVSQEFNAATAAAATRIVSIAGTAGNDSISITERDGIISANVNGTVTTYTASTIRRFSIDTGKGNDFIALQTSKGTNVTTVAVSVLGGAGDDVIIGGSRNDTIYGSAGNDRLIGGKGRDSLFGGTGNDLLDGGLDRDILNGGQEGINTGDGTDTISGGGGNDSVDYTTRTDNLILSLNGLAVSGATNEKDALGTDIEDIFSGSGNDRLAGSTSANVLIGGPGNDTINGGAGNDKLIGLLGQDSITGADGIDFYGIRDGSRDDFDAPTGDLVFTLPEVVIGDELVDFSQQSQRFIGRDAPQSQD